MEREAKIDYIEKDVTLDRSDNPNNWIFLSYLFLRLDIRGVFYSIKTVGIRKMKPLVHEWAIKKKLFIDNFKKVFPLVVTCYAGSVLVNIGRIGAHFCL